MDHLQAETRREYTARINRVMNYVSTNLDGDLSLESLADVAGFSPWHFHRVFRGMTGETLAAFIQRQRLQAAATRLRYNLREKVSSVAYACGFSSPSNFARAFKERYGVSAVEFRQLSISKQGEAISKDGEDFPETAFHTGDALDGATDSTPPTARYTMEFKVIELPRRTVAYVRVSNGYNPEHIGPAFGKVIGWAQAHKLMGPQSEVIGVSLDDPEVTPADKCRYDVCVTVPKGTRGEGEVGVYELPAGRYVVGRVQGRYATISKDLGDAYHEMFSEWFPRSGFKPGNSPCMEIYRESEDEYNQGIFICDICEPVEPL